MDRMKQRSFASRAFWLLAIIALNRLFGMVRTFFLAGIFGISHEAAAFEMAQNLTATLYDCTVGALLASMFLPSYLARRHGLDERRADRFAITLALFLAIGVFLLFLPLILFPHKVLSLVVKNVSEQALITTAACLPPLSLARVLLAVASIFTGMLQADRKPLIPALVYASASFISIPLVYFFQNRLSAISLSYGLLVIDFAVFLVLFRIVYPRHRTQKLASILPQYPSKTVKRAVGVLFFSAYLPLITGLSTFFFATVGNDAGVAVGGYSLKPILLTVALLVAAFHGVYYPRLAENRRRVFQTAKRPLALFLCLSLLAAIGFLLLAKPLLAFWLQNADISPEFMLTAVRFMRLYAVALPLLLLASIDNEIAYLCGKVKAVATITLLSLLFNIFVFYLLKDSFGIDAVPLALVASAALRAFFTQRLLYRIPRTENRIKLMLVLSDCNVGGAGRQMLNYLSHCNRNRFDVTVVLPKHSLLAPKVRELGFPVLPCGKESSFSFSSLFSYYRTIKKQRPHILHANASLSARIAAFLAGVPIRIYTRHCVFPLSSLFAHKLPRLGMRFATSLLSTSVIAVAEEAANNLYGMGVKPQKVSVIVNGVDPIPKNKNHRTNIRQQYGISPEETLAVICARLEPDKGIHVLIQAISLLSQAQHRISVLIVGKGSEEKNLRNLTQAENLTQCIHFCGFVQDVSPYLNAADCYVNCSVGTEATSLAIAEAMSLSLPIVASRYGGNTAMVQDGKNGILVPPNNPHALADALLIMTDDKLRQRFGKNSYEIYASTFSAETMARNNEALYQNLFIKKGYSLP